MIRRAAELLARRTRFTKRLPDDFQGREICVSGANQLAVFKPGAAGLDPMLLDWARSLVRPGLRVWDIGANMGFFALPAAARGADVLAFEPDPFNQELLNRSRALNCDLALEVIPVAVAQSVGLASFNVVQRGRSANRLTHVAQGTQTGGIRQQTSVVTVSLDWMLERRSPPDMIKCDAEGAELEILLGAAATLRSCRPIWIVEIEHENAPQIEALMKAADYTLHDAGKRGFPRCESLKGVWNALFAPNERPLAVLPISPAQSTRRA